ncbi:MULTISPECIES: carboxymuconolactone decarboxylase family protein [Streptomyces]|uniref:carboxymuconolactone decarboxylase family protein n=1 Tax=Streptomyces TaxID=1883 RepID=UPI00136FA53B|nr:MULTISPECIES: carboxymuconolactone decarboxylase family protein [unclassified Streptomyces]MBQ0964179.1 carboxymuconolactone decarboxylase family protein [Streptomyces sp. RK74B]MBQ1003391.1 carboxymuconolactone decarboxylase family protein [Streptomyces sp. RK23]MZG16862.1 carboxymuconolactone decarboxylase family protein [Streptomyces sp. SID5914]
MTQTPVHTDAETAGSTGERRVFIDKQSPEAYTALRATAEAVRGVAAAAGLDRTLVELVNIRVSQLNACAYCLNVHTRAALRGGETTQRLGVLPAWRDTELFSPAERAALALAEATTHPADANAQSAAYAQARGVLSEDQISAVIWVAISINAFNRVSVLSKHPVRGAPPA